jgi:putative transcriptional regulator
MKELLAEYALGMLSPEQASAVEEAVARDPQLEAELRAWHETAAQLALALPAERAPEGLWKRLERDAVRPRPFAAFVARVAAAMEVSEAVARRLLDRIDAASSWVAGPSPSSRLYHVEPGPAILAVNGIAGFVRVEPGTVFPRHKHLGPEHVLVLQGGFRDEDGSDVVAGQDSYQPAGSNHEFVAHEGEPLIYLAVIRGQVDFGSGFEL